MISYVSYQDFIDGGGVAGTADQPTVERLLGLSSMAANKYCLGRIGDGFNSLTAMQQECIQLAVIYNTNSLIAQGEGVYTGAELGTAVIQSYSAMNTSTTFKDNAGDKMATLTSLSQLAKQFLMRTGLCYRGLR